MRITMRQPPYPCKVGLHLKVSIGNEHELYMGHIVDTSGNTNKLGEWQEYELPINIMHHHSVMKKIMNPITQDFFETMGIVFLAESDK